MHQVSKPRAANQSITDESGRPGTYRSKVGCEAMDEPCTKRIVPAGAVPGAGFLFQRNNRTPPFVVQCSVPPSQVVVVGIAASPCLSRGVKERRFLRHCGPRRNDAGGSGAHGVR